ncbi:sulfotransferase domain-containing protein [Carboxylicivirga mesophila]|uniref:Sulfotransferase domain-containing protein n=1 Tax=Carboxylicivirga mesophila TaxID=1166478 RepID=A0ABS5K5L6_9BACT|nr:sulfotransferase domain-containing protein [Carboxylicivirga mesophila]MBS2210207.1 sulfotransferase domain-containing protein [Carboxylicivirga mesophila]
MMNKSRQILKQTLIDKFFPEYRLRRALLEDNCLIAMSNNSYWIYTLMKSGTTYTLLFLANYLSYIKGDKEWVDFDKMQSDYFFHSSESNIMKRNLGETFNNLKSLLKEPSSRQIVHSHKFINGDLWYKNFSLYRNPLDYLISIYFFHYINRGIKITHPREIIDEKLGDFTKVYRSQKLLQKRYADRVYIESYENLIVRPKEVFEKLIRFFEIEYDANAMDFAMNNASKKKIKEMESKRGEAIVAGSSKYKGSFVRSGKIGEWKEYFNDQDVKNIEKKLKEEDINLNDFNLG